MTTPSLSTSHMGGGTNHVLRVHTPSGLYRVTIDRME